MDHQRDLHLRDYLRVLRKRKWAALATFGAVIAGAGIYLQRAVPIYSAGASLVVEKGEPVNINLNNSYYVSWDPNFLQTQVQLLQSAAIAEKAAEMLLAGGEGAAILAGMGVADAAGAIRVVRGGLSVATVPESRIFRISYTSAIPDLAALVPNTVAEAYREELLEMNVSSSQHAIEWLSRKSEEEAQRLGDAERALQEYVKRNDVISLEYRLKSVPEEISELSLQVTKAETRRKELEPVHGLIAAAGEDPSALLGVPAVEKDQVVQTLRSQILGAEQSVKELAKKYGPKHPTMKAALGELEALKAKRDREVRRVVEALRSEYEMARANEENLRARLAGKKAEALRLNEKYVEYEMLKVAADTNKQFYDTLYRKTKEHTIAGQIQNVKVSVIERAEVPASPVRPNRVRIAVLGLLGALLAAVGAALFADYLDNTVVSPEEAERRTGVPVVGIVPQYREKGKLVEESVMKEPRTPLSERYKALRTSVLLAEPNGDGHRSILVTSMVPEEGKTASAVNLAAAFAQSGYQVLLVDADLRKPRVHKVLGVEDGRGFAAYLAGEAEEPGIVTTAVENLSLLPAGAPPPNPSELIGSKRMREMALGLRERFDIVVFDSSPALTVADSLVLSREVDTTLVVVRAGRTTWDLLERGMKTFADVKADVMGLVMNGVDEQKNGYYYYRKYDSYYKSGPSGKG